MYNTYYIILGINTAGIIRTAPQPAAARPHHPARSDTHTQTGELDALQRIGQGELTWCGLCREVGLGEHQVDAFWEQMEMMRKMREESW